MKNTIIYLIRHAETVEENGIRNTNEDFQLINEKEILSVKGEEEARKLSENIELQNMMSFGQVITQEQRQLQNIYS